MLRGFPVLPPPPPPQAGSITEQSLPMVFWHSEAPSEPEHSFAKVPKVKKTVGEKILFGIFSTQKASLKHGTN